MRDNRRRNRNIGTPKSGHGANNRLRIPERWSDFSVYWQKLVEYTAVEKTVNDHTIAFLVERPRSGYYHFCTVQDVVRLLELLPSRHVEYIDLIVFRQPTVKQQLLESVWGRLGYWSEIGKYKGPGIYLEAQPEDLTLKWDKYLLPEGQVELMRLRKAGFKVESNTRGYCIRSSPGSIRAVQLYHTIPHEIGHYVDYMHCLETYEWNDDYNRFRQLYEAKPQREKEVFAHRYADEFKSGMEAKNLVPFEPICDSAVLRQDKLTPEWFANHRGK